MNRSELLQILASEKYGFLRIRAAVPHERLAHLVRTQEQPNPEELSLVSDSRRRLQVWIDKNKIQIESQLPCKGPNRGKCTIYPCSDGKHFDCLLAAEKYML